METHYSTLAWRIPWTEEPGGLSSLGSQSQTQQKRLCRHAWMYQVGQKNPFGFSCKMVLKTMNERFGQPNIISCFLPLANATYSLLLASVSLSLSLFQKLTPTY